MTDTKRVFFSRPVDQSFEAYVAWIKATVVELGGDPDEPPLSEAQCCDG